MKTLLTTRWSLVRILRFLMGTAGLIFAVRNHDMLLGAAGGILLLMAVFNFGCCAAGGCNVPTNSLKIKSNSKDPESTNYEEAV